MNCWHSCHADQWSDVTCRAALFNTALAYLQADSVSTCKATTNLLLVLLSGPRLDTAHWADIAKRSAQPAAAKDPAPGEQDWTAQRNQAIENANSRDQIIRSLAGGSGNASFGLRDTLAAISRSVHDASVQALRHSTITLAAVLQNCQSEYRDLTEKADHTPMTRSCSSRPGRSKSSAS